MPDSNKQWLKSAWNYSDCALPALASLLVFLFLMFQVLSSEWRVKGPDTEIVEIGMLLKEKSEYTATLKDAFDATEPEVSGGSQQTPAAERYTFNDWKAAVSSSGLIVWRYTSALLAIALLCASIIAGYVIWSVLGTFSVRKRWIIALALFLLCAAFFAVAGFRMGGLEAGTKFMRQFLGNIDAQLSGASLVEKEIKMAYAGYVVATYLLVASCLNLAPFRKENALSLPVKTERKAIEEKSMELEAQHIVVRLRYLHLLLYVGAVVLAIATLRQKLMFKWSLDYLPPVAAFGEKNPALLGIKLIYERLDALATSNVTAGGILNTMILAAIYLPAALVLQKRARDLSFRAVNSRRNVTVVGEESQPEANREDDEETPANEDDWMKARGLTFPLKEQLPRIAAILSPLLAGPISELLVFFKR